MGFFSRIARFLTGRRERATPPPPTPPRGPDYEPESDLPPNWDIVALWSLRSGKTDVDPSSVSDADILSADQIIVRHIDPDNGVVSYRTIHGAVSRQQVGQLIIFNIANPAGSPPGSRREDR